MKKLNDWKKIRDFPVSIFVRSLTTGNLLPAKILRISDWRYYFGLPWIQYSYVGTRLNFGWDFLGPHWARPSEFVIKDCAEAYK